MRHGQVSCNDTSSALLSTQGSARMVLKNAGPNTVFVGLSGVTTTTGFQIEIDEEVTIVAGDDLALHAVCASAETATVHYIVS